MLPLNDENSGLNLQFIFNLDELPADLVSSIEELGHNLAPYRQLIVIGHGGRALWGALKSSGIKSDNPIDDFTINAIEQSFANFFSECRYQILYPSDQPVSLQQLGSLAGWHHPSPFLVGINRQWGSWFAYRALILSDTSFEPSKAVLSDSPCESCESRPCISACPAKAMDGGDFELQRCINYRKQADSSCRVCCLARISCPVAPEHRYSDEQIHYHYGVSMKCIEELY